MTNKELRRKVAVAVVCGAFKILFPGAADMITGIDQIASATGKLREGSRAFEALPRRLEDTVDNIAERFARFDRIDLEKAKEAVATDAVLVALRSVNITKHAFSRDSISVPKLRLLLDPLVRESMRRSISDTAAEQHGLLILRVACLYVASLVRELPSFDSDVAWEAYVLSRTIDVVMERAIISVTLPQFRVGTPDEISHFEADYRTDMATTYQYAELLGVNLPIELTRQPIRVAYISLRVDGARSSSPARNAFFQDDQKVDIAFGQIANESGNARHGARILLSGEAGSGKTTITQWLAISLANQELAGSIDAWKNCIPFVVPLRTLYVSQLEPTHDSLVITGISRDNAIPKDWVSGHLRTGKAVAIFDGLDELTNNDQRRALGWIDRLISDNPAAHFIVTSRPDGLDTEWFEDHDFRRLDLKALEPEEASECIERWFSALINASSPIERIEYGRRQDQLLHDLASRPAVRDLSATPLLCAMLCAFYAHALSESIPQTRIELYRRVITSLVDHRDRARKVNDPSTSNISYREKITLLQAIARHMTESQRSSIRLDPPERLAKADLADSYGRQVIEGVQTRTAFDIVREELDGMIMTAPSADEALSYILRRSIILKRVGNNECQFAHRSIQEFLAARSYAYDGDVSGVLRKLDQPDWRRIIVLAAGATRNKRVTTEIVDGILNLARETPERSRELIILAAECLGAATQVESKSASHARERIREVLPPRSIDEARTFSLLGDELLGWLRWTEGMEVDTAKACIFAASRIGGLDALNILSAYARSSGRANFVGDLISAWDLFEPKEYAERVLAFLPLEQTTVVVRSERMLPAVVAARGVRILELEPGCNLEDMSFTDDLPAVRELTYRRGALRSLSLSGQPGVRKLIVSENIQLTNIDDLNLFRHLDTLDVSGCSNLTSLASIRALEKLKVLYLDNCTGIFDFDAIRKLIGLRTLSVNGCHINSLEFLDTLGDLRLLRAIVSDEGVDNSLALKKCVSLVHLDLKLSPIRRKTLGSLPRSLRKLNLNGHITESDARRISECDGLRHLSITNLAEGFSVLDLSKLAVLQSLSVTGCSELVDASGIERSSKLEELDLSGSGIVNMDFARNFKSLRRIRLDECACLSDISILETLPNLTYVSLDGVPGVADDVIARLRTRALNPVIVEHDPYPDFSSPAFVTTAE